jgi:hypothetical protein
MKSKFLLVIGSLSLASFTFANDSKPADKPAPAKKEIAKETCDESCCEKEAPAEMKKAEAKPAPAAQPKK